MGHTHSDKDHSHHNPKNYNRAFAVGIALNLIFVVVEVIYGNLSNSLALISDAGHNLSDVLSLVLAWSATILVRKRPTQKYSYGLKSSSILASLTNSIFLLVVIGAIAWEAIVRFQHPTPVASMTIIWVAGIGFFINAITSYFFASGSKGDLNIRGAFLHLAVDALVSLSVVVAGILMIYTGWMWIDPLISLLICVVVIFGTWSLLKESLSLVFQAVPSGIKRDQVFSYLSNLPGVKEVHDLHIWGMSTTETALTVHLIMPQGHPGDSFFEELNHELEKRFHIHHVTVQVELGNGGTCCKLASDEVV